MYKFEDHTYLNLVIFKPNQAVEVSGDSVAETVCHTVWVTTARRVK